MSGHEINCEGQYFLVLELHTSTIHLCHDLNYTIHGRTDRTMVWHMIRGKESVAYNIIIEIVVTLPGYRFLIRD